MLVSHFQDLFLIGHRILASGFLRYVQRGAGEENQDLPIGLMLRRGPDASAF